MIYVDQPIHRYRGMLMCHMWSDSLEELLEMVDKIGVDRKWLQKPPHASWIHFDIAKSKRELAVKMGAIETDRYGPVEHVARMNLLSENEELVFLAVKKINHIEKVRAERRRRTLFEL